MLRSPGATFFAQSGTVVVVRVPVGTKPVVFVSRLRLGIDVTRRYRKRGSKTVIDYR